MSLALPAFGALTAGCVMTILFFTVGCAAALGSSFRTLVEDALMVVLTEGTANFAFHSPLDWARLNGRGLTDWSLVAGTGLALLGILLNHLARRSSPRKKHRAE